MGGRRFGLSFSWKRALGLSAAKARLSRVLGIPLTRSGRERKLGRTMMPGCCLGPCLAILGCLAVFTLGVLVR